MRREPFVYLGLLLLTLATFWPVLGNDFINYDDPEYVTTNVHIQSGLKASTVRWAFTSTESSNWHPLTWLSHSLDWQVFGSNPKGHHAMSLGFHAANALLLLLLLQQLTGKLWPSAFVASLFAVHPLHVESVAWVAERKDVLSVFFGLLTLLAYNLYVRKRTAATYLLTLVLFALALMAKPMMVTLPLVLLLIDYWPLQRFALNRKPDGKNKSKPAPDKRPSVKQLLLEKIPFFTLTLFSCMITYWAQVHGSSVMSSEEFPIGDRLENSLVSCVTYLLKMIWPAHLAVFYPLDHSLPAWKVTASAAAIIFLCWLSIRNARYRPYLLTGWFWFLIMLAPVIGIVQAGLQARADRYTYLALTGPFIIIAWGMAELSERFQWPGFAISLGSAGAIAACAVTTRSDLTYWKNSVSLFRHAASVTSENVIVESDLGNALMIEGRFDEALIHLQKALAIWPENTMAHYNIGLLRQFRGELNEAADAFRTTIQTRPGFIPAHRSLGLLLMASGRYSEAEDQFRIVLRSQPEDINIRREFGAALAVQQKNDEAEIELQKVLQQLPNDVQSRQNLGNVFAAKGDVAGAVAEYSKVIELAPTNSVARESFAKILLNNRQIEKANSVLREGLKIQPTIQAYTLLASINVRGSNAPEAVRLYQAALKLKPDAAGIMNNLGWILATSPDDTARNGTEAVRLAEKACGITQYKQPMFVGTLAAAYAEAGRFPDAITMAQKACDAASAAGNQALFKKDQELLELFRSGRPYRESNFD